MKKIELTQGKFALIDDEYFDELSKYKWSFDGNYASRSIRIGKVDGKYKTKKIYMHRLILNASNNEIVDHINKDTLDNRFENLRLATKTINGMNRGKNKNNTSGYKGVGFKSNRKNPWYARIVINGKVKFLGHFKTPKEASIIYEKELTNYFLKLA